MLLITRSALNSFRSRNSFFNIMLDLFIFCCVQWHHLIAWNFIIFVFIMVIFTIAFIFIIPFILIIVISTGNVAMFMSLSRGNALIRHMRLCHSLKRQKKQKPHKTNIIDTMMLFDGHGFYQFFDNKWYWWWLGQWNLHESIQELKLHV